MENNKNNNDINNIKRKFIIRKDKDFDDLLKVKEFFEDPNKFWTKDKKMIIGNLNLFKNKQNKKIAKGKSISLSDSLPNNIENKELKLKKKNLKVKSKSYTQGEVSIPTKKKTYILSRPKTSSITKKNNFNLNPKLNTYLNNLKNNNELYYEQIGIHYQKKSLSEILNILEKSKDREEKNKIKGTDCLFPKDVKKEIRQNFYDQETILKKKMKLKNNSDLLSKLISSKIKRKEDELLFNQIEEFRLKKQLIEYIEKSKGIRDKFGNNYWVADLRRPKKQDEIRINYFQNGNINKYPEKIIDYADKDVEFINDPNRLKKNKYAKLLKNLSLNNLIISNMGLNINNIEKMNEISVIKGRNIVEQEYFGIIDGNNNMSTGNKMFKLYKDPLERKYKNIKDLVCEENYNNNYKEFKNKSFNMNRKKKMDENNNVANKYKSKKNKKNGLFRSQSQIEENDNNKKKISYLKEAMEIFKRENTKHSIKIISSS